MAQPSPSSHRTQAVVGELPEDFLRVGSSGGNLSQVDQDALLAQQLAAGDSFVNHAQPNCGGRLRFTVVQAKLVKNYGLTKMDLYCRIRVGHHVLETATAYAGGKTPAWNKTLHCLVAPGVDSVYLELFDESAFASDTRIAWGHFQIPEGVFSGRTVDEWYPLSGKSGDGTEGTINIVLSYANAPPVQQFMPFPMVQQMPVSPSQQMVMVPQGGVAQPVFLNGVAYYPAAGVPNVGYAPAQQQQQHRQAQPSPVTIRNEDVLQLKEVFPNMDEEVIRSVLEANRGDKEAALNTLLSLSQDS